MIDPMNQNGAAEAHMAEPLPLELKTKDPRDGVGFDALRADLELAAAAETAILPREPATEWRNPSDIDNSDAGAFKISPAVEVGTVGAALPAILDESAVIDYEVIPEKQIKAVIAEMESIYLAAKIDGLADKSGAILVKAYKVHTKEVIAKLKLRRKDNKAGILEWGRKVDAAAVALITPLEAIRDHLEKEEDRIAVEREKVAEAKRVATAAILQGRIDQLTAVGGVVDVALLAVAGDRVFQAMLKTATDAKAAREAQALANAAAQAEAAAKAALDAKAKAEADRLAQEAADAERIQHIQEEEARQAAARAEQAARQAELNAQAAALAEKQAKLDADKAEAERAAREEAIRKDAAEKERVRLEAEARERRVAEEARVKAEAERKAAEEKRLAEIAAAAPDADKLAEFARFLEGKAPPEMATVAGQLARVEIVSALDRLEKFIRAKAAALTEFTPAKQ